MYEDAIRPTWTPRVGKNELKRLYQDDARGIRNEKPNLSNQEKNR